MARQTRHLSSLAVSPLRHDVSFTSDASSLKEEREDRLDNAVIQNVALFVVDFTR
jgi:hypothetical protein